MNTKIVPLGDSALLIDFGNEISLDLNARAIALANYLDANPTAGYIESVPAYSSVTIFYDILEVRRAFPKFQTAFDAVRASVEGVLSSIDMVARNESRTVEIPVDFSDMHALDLGAIVEKSGLTTEGLIDVFTSKTYHVYMLGFLPGFAYMGDVDERIAMPRRSSPRRRVPRGSVGIAGRQTGVYPLESPGGWQIIGRTEIEMFTPNAESPCLLQPGDQVRFVEAVG